MKFGIRKPSLKKSVKARTTGNLNRQVKSKINPVVQVIYGYITLFAILSLILKPFLVCPFNIWLLIIVFVLFDVSPLKDSSYPFSFSLRLRLQTRS